ncbi:MAG: Holliday junction resolvase RuvX [Cytophagales bacterium]|nr:Holliday junction resolvase RuvX [Cytophagales bacterium]
MARVIGIDYGTKRVGLATTDPLQIVTSPLDTIPTDKVLDFLKNYCQQEEVEAFALGLPKRLNDEDTHATSFVMEFKTKLEELFPSIPVNLVDERYTSKMAMDIMIAGGMKKKNRRKKENLDKISAAVILQSYLDSNTLL